MLLSSDVSSLHLVDESPSLLQFSLLLSLPIESKLPVNKPCFLFDHVDFTYHCSLLRPDSDELVISASHETERVLAYRPDCIDFSSMSSFDAFDLYASTCIKKGR